MICPLSHKEVTSDFHEQNPFHRADSCLAGNELRPPHAKLWAGHAQP